MTGNTEENMQTTANAEEEAPAQEKTPQELADYVKEMYEKIHLLYDDFNRARLLEYIELVNSPKKLFWLNFFSGLAKGLGLTIGTAIVLTILFKVTQHIIALNIPYITVWISDWIAQVTDLLRSTK